MQRIAIIGAGQAGLQLALGLLQAGREVTLHSGRSAGQIRVGPLLPSLCMFDVALETERDLALNFWESDCPKIEGVAFALPGPAGGNALRWTARLDGFAQAVDPRVKIPRWMAEFEAHGGELVTQEPAVEDLEACARSHSLVIVAGGEGTPGRLFAPDSARSRFQQPQRALALACVRNLRPAEPIAAVSYNLLPGVGEYIAFPALTVTGPCHVLVFEGVPGGPMDCWQDVRGPQAHLAKSRWVLETFFPGEAERCRDIELTDDNGLLTGGVVPAVRRPIGVLPSGANVLGMADAVVLHDPVTSQGANDAARCAEIYLESILERGDGPADAAWMQQTFDRYWSGYGQWVTAWTNLLLQAPAHVYRLLESAAEKPAVAAAVANGFDDPRTLFPWFADPAEAEKFLQSAAREAGERFDRRDFRRALGQFATGVTVVTTCAPDGRRVGITVNSFASVSLDPPLVLWSIARQATNFEEFISATHFAVNVLEAGQHHLSRRFSTPMADKFAGVDCEHGPCGLPLLQGASARFICRTVQQYDGGDHVILLGEVEAYSWAEAEPLVFHSGRYRVATRHPEVAE